MDPISDEITNLDDERMQQLFEVISEWPIQKLQSHCLDQSDLLLVQKIFALFTND